MITALALCLAMSAAAASEPVATWDFGDAAEAARWQPNGQLADVSWDTGVLRCRATNWDPFFTRTDLEVPTDPYHYVVIRIKADKPGKGELFWTGQTAGAHGGFSQDKAVAFSVAGGDWEEVAVFPFWHTEDAIRQFRLDLYDGATFEIAWLRVYTWGQGAPPTTGVSSWLFGAGLDPWRVHPGARDYFAPPLRLNADEAGWATVRMRANRNMTAAILWAGRNRAGLQSYEFQVTGGPETLYYNVQLQGAPSWAGDILALGLRIPDDEGLETRVESISLSDKPSGPAQIQTLHFGFEDGLNRAERACGIVAEFINDGGSASGEFTLQLVLPDGVTLLEGEARQTVAPLAFRQHARRAWQVRGAQPGVAYTVGLEFTGPDAPGAQSVALTFDPPRPVQPADYVPEPRPIETELDVLAYYFPGWNAEVKWDPIRFVAPIRKPLLGYYDEGDPEVVDWQIKWAVENGITGFLVDWYWSAGSQSLTHWFEAYREARYRDYLDVAIMWANHNAPNTHSREDWRAVTREWIDRYFNLPRYYRVDGKPAVYIWAPDNIYRDLGGGDEVQAAFNESQEMARAAGYEGITFIAMGYNMSIERSERLFKEGYSGFTTYHEWGRAVEMSGIPRYARFEDVAVTSRAAWDRHESIAGPLTYYHVVDTGWDSRPWHGSRALVIDGRNADLFERILRDAKTFAAEHGKTSVVLAPLNEWGEGSYIEPCAEFGFDMYERVRKVFGKGDPAGWPENIGPSDVARGPYDFPHVEFTGRWTFDDGLEGWVEMMGVTKLVAEGGALRFQSASDDPALQVRTLGLQAAEAPVLVVRMQAVGPLRENDHGQLFFSEGGKAMTEATSVTFPLEHDGAMHEYRVDLAAHPRWRGAITSLRFDPCSTRGVEFTIEEMRFEK